MEQIAIGQADVRYEKAGIRVEKKTLQQGRSRGVDVVEIRRGDAAVSFLPTRGAALQQAVFDGTPLFWKSPVGPVNPAFMNLLRNEGLGWLDGFCEGIARCGLEHFGNPVRETLVNNQGQPMAVFRPLHGEIGQIPAEAVSVEIESADEVAIRSVLAFASVFGSKYAVRSTCRISFTERSLSVTDSVENRSRERDLPVKLCYHINFGAPLLDDKADLVRSAPLETLPMSPHAEAGLHQMDRFGPPEKGFVEQCFFMRYGMDQGALSFLLRNPGIGAAAELSFSPEDFPCLIAWKQLGMDEYVLGLEPATCAPPSLAQERDLPGPPVLPPEARRSFSFRIRLVTGRQEIEQTARRITEAAS
jgi:galactose mutarotase-like enzyme